MILSISKLQPSIPLACHPLCSTQAWLGDNEELVKKTKELVAKGVTEDRLLSENAAP